MSHRRPSVFRLFSLSLSAVILPLIFIVQCKAQTIGPNTTSNQASKSSTITDSGDINGRSANQGSIISDIDKSAERAAGSQNQTGSTTQGRLGDSVQIDQKAELATFTKSNLPACPCSPGRIVRVTDDVRGLWVTDGTYWFPLANEADIRWFGAKPDDGVDDSSALSSALAVAPVVKVPKGTFRIGTNLTVPAGKSLMIENGGMISVDATKTFTLAGHFEAGLYKTFTGNGKVAFGLDTTNSLANRVVELFPQWWGAAADGATDDLLPLTKSIESAASCHGRVHLVGNYRVSGALSLPNGVSLIGGAGNAQNWAWLTVDGAQGFSGNYLLASNPAPALNQYSTIENIEFNVVNIKNRNFEVVHIAGWSETSSVRNISFNLRDSVISRVLYFNNYGPVEFANISLYYPNGMTLVENEPIYLKAVNGLIVHNLNYTAVSPKAPYFEGGLFALLEGLQIETHPTAASEPSITIYSGTGGVTLRDSNLLTDVDNSTGVKILSNVFPDLGSYLIENVAAQRHTGVSKGSFDKLVVIRDNRGVEKSWDAARLMTSANAQRPTMIQRFSMREQVFGGVETNNSSRVFQDLYLFNNIANNSTVTVPFNPRVLIGGNGTGNVLILVNARSNRTNNAAMIWLTYVDLPERSGGLQPVFNYIVGNSSSNWSAAYSAEGINLTNKAGSKMDEVTVTIIHSTFYTWPIG